MPAAVAPTAGSAPRAVRADGELSRERLQKAALHLFAEQGYAKTSVRQIALAAQVNVAAVSYYFGDKAGLYRAVYTGWHGSSAEGSAALSPPACDASDLHEMYAKFVAPLKRGTEVRLWLKLHRREMMEPSGLWQDKLDNGIRPLHAALTSMLCARFGIAKPDDDVHRLAISMAGLAVHLYVGSEAIDALAPQLTRNAKALDLWGERLVSYAEAMIASECKRRRLAAGLRATASLEALGALDNEAAVKPAVTARSGLGKMTKQRNESTTRRVPR